MAPDFSHNIETVVPMNVYLMHYGVSFNPSYLSLFLAYFLKKGEKLTKEGVDRLLHFLFIRSHKIDRYT